MTSAQLNLITPLDAPLPPPPEGEVLTASQWTTLLAIADTIIPSIEMPTSASPQKLCLQKGEYTAAIHTLEKKTSAPTTTHLANLDLSERYLQEFASSVPEFRHLLRRTLGEFVREDARKGIRVILSALEYVHLGLEVAGLHERLTSY